MDEILNKFGGTENILAAIKNGAAKAGRATTKMMLELLYVMKSPNTSLANKTIIVSALAYQLLPKDILPCKKYGLLGFLDNGITLAVAYNRVKSLITPEIDQKVTNTLNNWFGENTQEFAEYEVVD